MALGTMSIAPALAMPASSPASGIADNHPRRGAHQRRLPRQVAQHLPGYRGTDQPIVLQLGQSDSPCPRRSIVTACDTFGTAAAALTNRRVASVHRKNTTARARESPQRSATIRTPPGVDRRTRFSCRDIRLHQGIQTIVAHALPRSCLPSGPQSPQIRRQSASGFVNSIHGQAPFRSDCTLGDRCYQTLQLCVFRRYKSLLAVGGIGLVLKRKTHEHQRDRYARGHVGDIGT